MRLHSICALLTAIAIGVSAPAAVFGASKKYKTEVTNHVSLGDINIQLDEYTLDESGKEIPMPDVSSVFPGGVLSQIVRITNIARDAWIRVNLRFVSENTIEGLDHSLVNLASDDWKEIGDYYYYTKPVPHGSRVDFMESLRIPNSFNGSSVNASFDVVVSADAVQVQNFTPDFNSNDPWFGTLIETCVHEDYEMPGEKTQTAFSVEFRGGAEGFIRVGDDFFSNWIEMMPGDTVSDKVQVKNSYASPIKLYFSTETIAGDKLLDQLDLRITKKDGSVVYEGKMNKALATPVLLGEYKNGDTDELSYTVHVPPELTNAFALTDTRVKWIFETELTDPEPTPTPKPDPTPTPNVTPTPTPGTPTPGTSTSTGGGGGNTSVTNVKTGDGQAMLWYLGLVAGASAALAAMFYAMKRRGRR